MSNFIKIEDDRDYDKIKDIMNEEKIEYSSDSLCNMFYEQQAKYRIECYLDDYPKLSDELKKKIINIYYEELAEDFYNIVSNDDIEFNTTNEFFNKLEKDGDLDLSEYEE